MRILVSAFEDQASAFSLAAFGGRLFTTKIWGLGCLGGGTRCGVAWNTLFLALSCAVACTALGLAFALIATRTAFPHKRLLRVLSVLPIITPPFVIGLGLILLFGRSGIVNQILGDGLMALFGAPMPHADHAERAVRAALEMLELVAGFDREQAAQGKPEIRIGVGIASGQVIAGYTGTERRVTYTCVGDTVNLAAHLEAHTKVLGRPILIDERTRAGLGRDVRVEDHGPVQFKTRAQLVRVFAVVSGE